LTPLRQTDDTPLKRAYRRAMERTYIVCIVISGLGLVAITLIIPLGVVMRYWVQRPLSWPEPASVIMMVVFSFIGGAAVYRANVHIAVEALINAVRPSLQRWMRHGVNLCIAVIALFMLMYGIQLCITTRFSTIAEFPWLSVAVAYLPIPVAGLLTLLFLIERVWIGDPPKSSVMYADGEAELE
jgi:TRAP-type C4-dicarboxylate transport system permease small subunit